MGIEEFSTLVKELGFPVVVALFVLVRLNGKVGKNTEAIDRNTQAQHQTSDRLQRGIAHMSELLATIATRGEETKETLRRIEDLERARVREEAKEASL